MDKKKHWESVYSTKNLTDVSWYQQIPTTSINLIKKVSGSGAAIIDAGGGDSFLAEKLLETGYSDITVADISEHAVNRAKERAHSTSINYIVTDITELNIQKRFDVWHDRAVFHFLTKEEDVKKYIAVVEKHLKPGGYFILGTFSLTGPTKCSGVEITQYDKQTLEKLFEKNFTLIESFEETHQTPFNTTQDFIFAVFKKKKRISSIDAETSSA